MTTRRKSFDTEASRGLNANDVDYPPAVSARINGVVAAASAVEISRLAAIGPPRVSNNLKTGVIQSQLRHSQSGERAIEGHRRFPPEVNEGPERYGPLECLVAGTRNLTQKRIRIK
jgi:hypothetical protein